MTSTEENCFKMEDAVSFLSSDRENKDTEAANEATFFQKLRQNEEFRHRIIHTGAVCWSFIASGWAVGMGGPTFPDLRQIVQVDLASASWLFTVSAIGNVVGSFVFGALYDRLNKHMLFVVTTFFYAVFVCLKPWSTTFPMMLVVFVIAGTFCGGLEAECHAEIPYIWGIESGPYMQCLQLSYCLGAILSPLASEPFLAKKVCSDSKNENGNVTFLPFQASTGFENNVSQRTTFGCSEIYEDTQVHYAFLIAAILILTSTFGYTFLYCKMSHVHRSTTKQPLESKEMTSGSSSDRPQNMPLKLKAIVLVLLAFLTMCYSIIEDGFSSFLMTFLLTHLQWSKEMGSYATGLFWACFVAGLCLGIFLVGCCKQTTLLTSYITFISVSLVGFLLASVFSIVPLIWIFTGALGFSLSVVWPCIFGWSSENVLKITGKISSLFLVSASLGAMFFPLLVGNLMALYSPLWFIYTLMIMMGFKALVYLSVRLIKHFYVDGKFQDA